MKKTGVFSFLGLVLGGALAAGSQPFTIETAVPTITASGAYATVERLTQPDFAGRLTGSAGFAAAATWVAAEMRRAGLRPLPEFPDYLQRFPITVTSVERATMEVVPVDDKGQPQSLAYFKEFLPLLYSGTGDATAEVVFVGYGITAPEMQRDDYAGLDVKGKIVMALRGAPKDGRDWLAHDSHRARTANARAHQAAGYLFAESAIANPNGNVITDLPMASISEELGNALLAGQKLTLEELHKVLAKGGVASFATGRKVHLAVSAKPARESQGANVIAMVPGSDPAVAREAIIIGAHLDHCGEWPALIPGADDNASGSAAVLEVARAAAKLRPRPRRAIVFVLFGGEEEGLLGSRFLVAHTPPSITKVAGVYNLDMVGAGTGAFVSGGKNFPELYQALEQARDRWSPGMPLKSGLSEGEPRADHGPFQAAGLAAVSLFGSGGQHHGYHSPEDTLWWITPKSIEAIARIVFSAAVTRADAR